MWQKLHFQTWPTHAPPSPDPFGCSGKATPWKAWEVESQSDQPLASCPRPELAQEPVLDICCVWAIICSGAPCDSSRPTLN